MRRILRRSVMGFLLVTPAVGVMSAAARNCDAASANKMRTFGASVSFPPHWIVTGDQQKARLKRWMLDDDDPLSFQEMLDEIGAEFVDGCAT